MPDWKLGFLKLNFSTSLYHISVACSAAVSNLVKWKRAIFGEFFKLVPILSSKSISLCIVYLPENIAMFSPLFFRSVLLACFSVFALAILFAQSCASRASSADHVIGGTSCRLRHSLWQSNAFFEKSSGKTNEIREEFGQSGKEKRMTSIGTEQRKLPDFWCVLKRTLFLFDIVRESAIFWTIVRYTQELTGGTLDGTIILRLAT